MRTAPFVCFGVAAIAVVFLSGHRGCMEDRVQDSMDVMTSLLEGFFLQQGEYPASLGVLYATRGSPEQPFIDPWGQPYHYSRLGSTYTLFSHGPDMSPKTLDDLFPGVHAISCTVAPGDAEHRAEMLRREKGTVTICDVASRNLGHLGFSLSEYYQAKGSYPKILHQLNDFRSDNDFRVAEGRYFAASMFVDPWGEPYVYRRLSFGYELFSSGADRLPNTHDDLIEGELSCSLPPYQAVISDQQAAIAKAHGWPAYDPCGIIIRLLESLSRIIDEYRTNTGRFPDYLAELYVGKNVAAVRDLIDPFGKVYSYWRTRSGYVLFSNGPDRLPGTDDDIALGDPFDKCKPPPYKDPAILRSQGANSASNGGAESAVPTISR